ncbi:MAG: hypothetical protein RLZZ400_892 [Actinomycetota bacterium]
MTKVAIAPSAKPEFEKAVIDAGAEVVELDSNVTALVWTDYHSPDLLARTLSENPQLQWVQLPFAGVDAFVKVLDLPIRFTCAKGAYKEPVAEHALALMLALGRAIPERVRAKTWGEKFAVSLYESKVLILGGGGIAEELVKLLEPFGCAVTVVRKSAIELPGVTTVTFNEFERHVPEADFVVIAAALTEETEGIINRSTLALMKPTAYLVNVARGKHVVTQDLIQALTQKTIAGAALDVTDPEPLPDGHPLWDVEDLIITPHTADTPAQVTRMLAERIRLNTLAFQGKGEWLGLVDPKLGY